MQKKLLLPILIVSALMVGCSESNTTNPSTIDSEDSSIVTNKDTIYEDKVFAPKHKEVNDEGYTTYYFDAVNGKDFNDGSQENPKKSLSAANSIISKVKGVKPTKILFKAGDSYQGSLLVQNFEALEDSPLIISVYGQDDSNKYVKFIGPKDGNCVIIRNSNVQVNYLECTSPLGYRGIFLNTQNYGVTKNVVVSNCYVHDINFNLGDLKIPEDGKALSLVETKKVCEDYRYSYVNGGIVVETGTNQYQGESWFENVFIEDNIIERVARTGIWTFSSFVYRPGVDWGHNHYYDDNTNYFPHRNVNICRNKILYAGGDSIVMGGVVDGFIEGNVSYHASYLGRGGYYNAGIWPHSCTNVVMQYNESAYTHLDNGCGDGDGFDIDIGNSNILFQYNYSHHNGNGGILLANNLSTMIHYDEKGNYILDEDGIPISSREFGTWKNVTMRNNVFADNRGSYIRVTGKIDDLIVENNTFIALGEKKNQNLIYSTDNGNGGVPGNNWLIQNNIICQRKENPAKFQMSFCRTFSFENNVFYNLLEETMNIINNEFKAKESIVKDPGFLDVEALDGYENCKKFLVSSELLSGAKKVEKAAKYDLNGNDVTNKRYYGAICQSK